MATAPPVVQTALKAPSIRSRPSTTASRTLGSSSSPNNKGSGTSPADLARRLLFPTLPAAAPLPPLLRSTDDETDPARKKTSHASATKLDTELYALLALALRAHVSPWWTKLSRYDRDFVPYLGSTLLADVVQRLAARARALDAPDLLFRALPFVLGQHFSDMREARRAAALRSFGATACASVEGAYRARAGHIGVCVGEDGVARVDGVYVRALLEGVLRALLPPVDWNCAAERAIVREVLAKVVVQDVIPLLSQPWFLHRLLLDVLKDGGAHAESRLGPKKAVETMSGSAGSGSVHSAIVCLLSTVQYLSGLCLTLIAWYKITVQAVKAVNKQQPVGSDSRQSSATANDPSPSPKGYALNLLWCASEVVRARERRTARAVIDAVELGLGFAEEFTDRWLAYTLGEHVLTEARMLSLVRSARDGLFPNGYPSRPAEAPSEDEQATLRAAAADAVAGVLPWALRALLLGADGARQRRTAAGVLSGIGRAECNVHVLMRLADVAVVGLFPEMGVAD